MHNFLEKITGQTYLEDAQTTIGHLEGRDGLNFRQREKLAAAQATMLRIRFGRRALLAGGALAAVRYVSGKESGSDESRASDEGLGRAREQNEQETIINIEMETPPKIEISSYGDDHRYVPKMVEGLNITLEEFRHFAAELIAFIDNRYISGFAEAFKRADVKGKRRLFKDFIMDVVKFLASLDPRIRTNILSKARGCKNLAQFYLDYINDFLIAADDARLLLWTPAIQVEDREFYDVVLAKVVTDTYASFELNKGHIRVPIHKLKLMGESKSNVVGNYNAVHDRILYIEEHLVRELSSLRTSYEYFDVASEVPFLRNATLLHEGMHAWLRRRFPKLFDNPRNANDLIKVPDGFTEKLPNGTPVVFKPTYTVANVNELTALGFELMQRANSKLKLLLFIGVAPEHSYALARDYVIAQLAGLPGNEALGRKIKARGGVYTDDIDKIVADNNSLSQNDVKAIGQKMYSLGIMILAHNEARL